MALDFKALIALWSKPVAEGEAGVAAFRAAYADPVIVNGTSMPLPALVDRARATRAAFADLEAEILEQIDTPGRTTVVFRMRGRHVGPWITPLGIVPPTGEIVERQIIDVLAHEGGVITRIWMVGDELGALVRAGALALVERRGSSL